MNAKAILGILVLVAGLLIATSVQAQVAISEDGVTFLDNPEPVWGLKQYKIGDRGPADGWVFYVTEDGLHGLEAASKDQSTAAQWGCYGTEIPGADGTVIGTGESNTEDTNDPVHGCATAGIAAAVAAEYVSTSGYFDWYLPSKDELDLMYDNLHDRLLPLGSFANDFYWSSSEYSASLAWYQLFFIGNQGGYAKNYPFRVRAVRAF